MHETIIWKVRRRKGFLQRSNSSKYRKNLSSNPPISSYALLRKNKALPTIGSNSRNSIFGQMLMVRNFSELLRGVGGFWQRLMISSGSFTLSIEYFEWIWKSAFNNSLIPRSVITGIPRPVFINTLEHTQYYP